MKKKYIPPTLSVITLQSGTHLCATSMPVGSDDQGGAEQLSRQFWGLPSDDEEPLNDSADSKWY